MLTRISLLAWALLGAVGVEAKHGVINQENSDIPANSDIARNLLHHARRVDQNQNGEYNNGDVDTSFLSGYSVKFQGCHHVQQWNPYADDDSDVRIMTKRLVRFRMCPSSSCTTDLTGCTSSYGDYVVDMGTYVTSYLEAAAYSQNGNNANRQLDQYDVSDYTECAELDMRRRLDQNADYSNGQYSNNDDYDGSYYMGPYCAEQGGEIRMGLFTDDTCSTFANNGEQAYYSATGMSMPYSESSMVSMNCMSCSASGDDGSYVSDFCTDIYSYAGKCETKMNVNYPNESSCSYIEGIKVIREDGVIRTSATKKSKAAAISIGVFLTIAVLLSGYVYYLRTSKSFSCLHMLLATLMDQHTNFVLSLFSSQSSAVPRSILLLPLKT